MPTYSPRHARRKDHLMLREIVTGRTRKITYTAYALIGLVLGAVQVGFAAAEAGQPVWLNVALAVFAFVGTALGFTARANVPAEPESGRSLHRSA